MFDAGRVEGCQFTSLHTAVKLIPQARTISDDEVWELERGAHTAEDEEARSF